MQSQKRQDMFIFGLFAIIFISSNIILPQQSDIFADSTELTYLASAIISLIFAFVANRIGQKNKAKKEQAEKEKLAAEKGMHPKQKAKKGKK